MASKLTKTYPKPLVVVGNTHIYIYNEDDANYYIILLFSISWQVVNDPHVLNQFGVFNTSLQQQRYAPPNNITDRGICSFGQARTNPLANVVWIRAEARNPDTTLERLEVRGYRGVTDTALLHLVECSPNLRYLDVTGTSVTAQGVRDFSALKPNCVVVSNAKDEVDGVAPVENCD